MKKSRFTEIQIVSMPKKEDTGMKVEDLCRKHGISSATYDNRKKKYGGMEAAEIKRLKALEDENARLKRMYPDQSLELQAAKDLIVRLRSIPHCPRNG